MAHNHTTELAKNKRIFDTMVERIKARCGTKDGVDLTGITGHGMFLTMPLNSAQYKIAKDQVGLKRRREQRKNLLLQWHERTDGCQNTDDGKRDGSP